MTLKRCIHCGNEADDEIVAVDHKSTCRSAGLEGDYTVISGSPREQETIQDTPTKKKRSE